MSKAKDWLNGADWARLVGILIATLVFDTILAVSLLGYSRSTGSIDLKLGFSKMGDILGDMGNLLITVVVIAAVVGLAVITIEQIFNKIVRYVIYTATIVLGLMFHDPIVNALTGISGIAIIVIAVFVLVQAIVLFLLSDWKKGSDGHA